MYRRIIAMLTAFVLLFTSLICRCRYISSSRAYSVAESYNSRSFDIYPIYPTICDRNGVSLNNNTKSLIAIVRPNERDISELSLIFSKDNIDAVTQTLRQGMPVIRNIDNYSHTRFIRIVEAVEENCPDMLAKHLINRDYGGLEASLPASRKSCRINYSVDALGRLLAGDNGRIITDKLPENVKITIDAEIQKIIEEACSGISKGAVVVADVNSSQIIASCSMGNDYINRALNPYAIGSIFKLVVCISALENNVTLTYDCNNKIVVGDTAFHCQNNKKHGVQNMKQALANSCNCYFINLALQLGAEKIRHTAESLGFMSDIELYDNYIASHGAFADAYTLSSKGQLALIGFGQGVLTDTPVHFSSVISAIANGGVYRPPTLRLEKVKGNRVMNSKNSDILRDYMRYVISHGTGSNADYNNSCAGKTATAQSGIYNNGTEVLNTFFAGFYPYDKPKYSIIIMCEDGTSGAGDCCPVFRTIVEKLDKM